MTMVVSRKQRIFFRYEGERGAFLVLHHGLLGSHEDWFSAGYVEELAKEFRVVIPDARGHGRSDKPTESSQYTQQQMADDLIEIMNELGIRNSHIVGYGLGALVGFELLRRYPERVRIAILGGGSPLMSGAVQDVHRAEAESLKAMGLADYLKALKDQGRVVRNTAVLEEETERPAALALMEAIAGWEPAPAERVQVTSPLTLFAGTDDPAAARVEASRSGVSRARLVHFPGFSHMRLFQERTQLMEEILRLLKSGRRDDEPRRDAGGPGQSASGGHGQSGSRRRDDDRRYAPPGRQEGQAYGNRRDDRGPPSPGPKPRADTRSDPTPSDGPSPIPGAALDGREAAEAVNHQGLSAEVEAVSSEKSGVAKEPVQEPQAGGAGPGGVAKQPVPDATSQPEADTRDREAEWGEAVFQDAAEQAGGALESQAVEGRSADRDASKHSSDGDAMNDTPGGKPPHE